MTLSKEQQRVYDWLGQDLRLPVYAKVYQGAIGLLQKKSDGYVTFVSHAGRDLMNSLASTVVGISRRQVQYKEHVEKIQDDWNDEWGSPEGGVLNQEEIGHFIPIKICKIITQLVEDHKSGRLRSSDADGLFFSTFLDYSDKEKIPDHFLSEWRSAKGWFMRHTHLRENDFGQDTEVKLKDHFRNLDGYLYVAASSQYERIKGLNEILESTNS